MRQRAKRDRRCNECGHVIMNRIAKEDVQDVWVGLREGITINELAASLGCSRTMIYKIKNKEFHPEWVQEIDKDNE